MERLPVFQLLGLQLIALPEDLRFATSEVFAYRDGIGVRLLPGSPEGEREARELRNQAMNEE
jgi:hypothetical protein